MNLDELRAFLLETLPKSQHGKVPAIITYVDDEANAEINTVQVIGAHAAIETVAMYGLEIGIDAHGNASDVLFPYGASIVE